MKVIIITPEIAIETSAPVTLNGITYQLVPFILLDGRMALPIGVLDTLSYSSYFSILETCETVEVQNEIT